ncbi:MAG: cytidylate kinase-like family protein [Desulfobacteraceae bacterium]|nr:cytidylate kinase-like family protein [Desulfobacteraceae bacterium]MBC2756024.1 cytidylate kinase-like family protein [Desulfobacteraceae bacterium]
MAVITINKEFGTRSQRVASKLAQKLGYEYIGDQLLAQIAKELNLSEHEANTFRQTSKSSVLRLVDKYTCSIVQKVVDREHGCLDDKAYSEKTKELVEKLYDNDNVIILGWGAQCLLKDKPNTLHVRLRKDLELKISELTERQNLSHKAAEHKITTDEKDLKVYIKEYFDADWNDARLYDLIIDMGKNSVLEAVDLICENLKHKLKE